jgi:hypothetical protein
MEPGFAVDFTYGGQAAQTWVAGETEPARWLGMKTGSVEIKDKEKATFIAYRCPQCYRVEWFAPPVEQTNLLLRPAGNVETEAKELLRPASLADTPSAHELKPHTEGETTDLKQSQSQ